MKTLISLLAMFVAIDLTIAAPPQPVTDLQIQVVDSTHVQLNWSPVAQDTLGQPLPCVYYDLYSGQAADFDFSPATWIDSTSALSYTDSLVGDLGFYRIKVQPCLEANPMDMVLIPAGQFMMGQAEVPGATPEHLVTLTHDFHLGRTEVTNAQFLEALNWAKSQGLVFVVGDYVQQYNVNLLRINISGFDWCEIRYNSGTQQFYLHAGTLDAGSFGPGEAYPGGSYDPANHPVKWVSWFGAACYCDWRSQMENLPRYYEGQWGQIPSPRNPYTALGYRLPTEAEWEFAAQYDDERTYPWGQATPTCTLVNYSISSSNRCVGWSSPVGAHPAGASALGLQDMAGNVWEWCNDWYANYSSGGVSDPPGPNDGGGRVPRGGSFYDGAAFLPCAFRGNTHPSSTYGYNGFRLCRTTL